ncbi:DUF4157 domain-containing protein [Streptomyces sp. NPDC047525]|uniref:eCIS core domain-containing protein n=1 Tax=Streptomyces sp. NPDC047525 TaxID=3155264 RepID=UPI0033E07689
MHNVIHSPGQPLPGAIRDEMSARFGHDFSRVRVHSEPRAAESAASVQARAYTVGRHIVLGNSMPDLLSDPGRKILAHELAHVVQQSATAPSGALPVSTSSDFAEREAADTAARVIRTRVGPGVQRDPAPQVGAARASAVQEDIETAGKEALDAADEIQSDWRQIRSGATGDPVLTAWLSAGDAVVALIRSHTTAALEASAQGDRELFLAYRTALAGDILTYQLTSWHVVVVTNYLGVEDGVRELRASFAVDDRHFTGRAEAEAVVLQLQGDFGKVRGRSTDLIQLVRTDIPMLVHGGEVNEVSITVTGGVFPQARSVFEMYIAEMIGLQASIEGALARINKYLGTARTEGVMQTVESLVQFIQTRGQSKGGGPKPGKNQRGRSEASKRKSVGEEKTAFKRKGEKERGKGKAAGMRFQVQWGSRAGGPTFGLPAVAPWDTGVTTAQAVATLGAVVALVRPEAAQAAAGLAGAKQIRWILSRPPAGVAGTHSWSEYFPYLRFRDARVDVENLRGHNLRR